MGTGQADPLPLRVLVPLPIPAAPLPAGAGAPSPRRRPDRLVLPALSPGRALGRQAPARGRRHPSPLRQRGRDGRLGRGLVLSAPPPGGDGGLVAARPQADPIRALV